MPPMPHLRLTPRTNFQEIDAMHVSVGRLLRRAVAASPILGLSLGCANAAMADTGFPYVDCGQVHDQLHQAHQRSGQRTARQCGNTIICEECELKKFTWLAMCMGWALAGVGGFANAADSIFHDAPASPRSLPADNLPPFGMLDADGKLVPTPPIPAGGLHRGFGSPPESTARGPSLFVAIAAARAAISTCHAAGFRVGVTVIDSAGEARAMLTADGSDGSHVFVAMRKALTALTFNMRSSKANEVVPKDSSLLARVTPNMFVEGGALPIVVGHETIGAIGVSGAGGTPIGHQDEVCAAAGLRKLELMQR
jgi:uncharacterized protein GlcG (DUF336 family)